MLAYLFDPKTKVLLGSVEVVAAIPESSTFIPPYENVAVSQYFVDGAWTFDDPATAVVEKLVLPINNIDLNAPKNGNIWKVGTKTVVTLTASTLIPAGNFTAIVERVVRGSVVADFRFDANIVAGESLNQLVMPLYFEESGNYQITPERLNQGLDEIGLPFHVAFTKVDIDVIVSIPSS